MNGWSSGAAPGPSLQLSTAPGSRTMRRLPEQRNTDPSGPMGRSSKAVRSAITARGKYPAAISQIRRRTISSSGSLRFLVYRRAAIFLTSPASRWRRIAREVGVVEKKTSG